MKGMFILVENGKRITKRKQNMFLLGKFEILP